MWCWGQVVKFEGVIPKYNSLAEFSRTNYSIPFLNEECGLKKLVLFVCVFIYMYFFLFLQIVFQVDASTQKSEESETFDVELTKNVQGLGITIAGYIGDKKLGSF